jgi:twinkle protein
MIVNPKSLLLEINQLYESGVARGHTTGWSNLDSFFSIKHGEFTVITGMPSHGKSEWLDALCVNLAIKHNYRICMFSPENHPLEMHAKKIIEKFVHKPFFGQRKMSQNEMFEGIEKMNQHFAFIKPKETEFTPMHIINEALPWLEQSTVQPRALVIDPWNEMDHYRPAGLSETEYISRVLTELRRAAREFKTHLFLVAHPMKLSKGPDGNYPVPRPYDISGSAHWFNKADNCIAIWRNVMNNPQLTQVHIQKVRFNSTGHPGVAELMYDYNQASYVYEQDFYRSKQ